MTWEEVDSYDRAAVVVAPFGAMEQHSLYLPLETDALIAQELSRRLDAACGGRLLILPTQWSGFSPHHMTFSGTITAPASTYMEMANQILSSNCPRGLSKSADPELARRRLGHS
jgi:creatinine amidohydrolase